MAKRLISIFALYSVCSGQAALNYNLPLDRPYTLRNAAPHPLEREFARQIRSTGPLSFIFPRPCVSALDSGRVCGDLHGFRYLDAARGSALSISPIGGYEYRYGEENVNAFDGGLLTTGASGPVSFYLDARMFTETHERFDHRSFDREFVERQDEEASGTVAYTSFSRFRSNLSYDMSWGRFTVARDAAHWGPGLFSNLALNANAIPFNQLTFTTHLGPLSVQTLYGQLALDTNWETDATGDTRSLYAHRYEWRATGNLVLGISEQLVIHKREAPFAFVPIVPLYIAKAVENEHLNNGNIAGDAAYRIPGFGLVYTEFLIDDLQSPTALFNDYWGNKWGWMLGGHWVGDWAGRVVGLVGEYSRVEPWVYTHKEPRTAQTAHFNQPLGNPLGPNSQAVILKGYLREGDSWYLSTRIDLTWKGTDPGSSLGDIQREEATKTFLAGVDAPDWMIRPYVWYDWKQVAAMGELGFGTRIETRLGVQLQY